MSMFDNLRNISRIASVMTLDFLDKQSSTSIHGYLVRPVPNPLKTSSVDITIWGAFPQMRLWVGDRTVQGAAKKDFRITSDLYEVTSEYDREKAELGDALISAQDIAGFMGTAFDAGKVEKALAVLRENQTTYDGQSFFDTDHVHLTNEPYSNLVDVVRADVAAPTPQEARAELVACQLRLMQNRVVRNTVLESAAAGEEIVVITRSNTVWSAFEILRTEPLLNGSSNTYVGKFKLWLDLAGDTDEVNSVDVISSLPNGPRPVLYLPFKEPNGVKFDISAEFRSRNIPFGMDARYGWCPGLPQCAVRTNPSAVLSG